MEFSELIKITKGFEGMLVEVDVYVPVSEQEWDTNVAGFWGYVRKCESSQSGKWVVWFREFESGPGAATVSFDPALFIDADYEANREEADQEAASDMGMTWTLKVRQAGITTVLMAYPDIK